MAELASFRLLGTADADILANVADGVFDRPVDPALARSFLDDPRHHIAVALDGDRVVGFASAVDYVHPDKPRQMWINEVGVAPTHRNRGAGTALIDLIVAHARSIGCTEAWVLTDEDNAAANAIYRRVGGVAQEPPQRMYSFQLRA